MTRKHSLLFIAATRDGAVIGPRRVVPYDALFAALAMIAIFFGLRLRLSSEEQRA